jgi:hypothetical protein
MDMHYSSPEMTEAAWSLWCLEREPCTRHIGLATLYVHRSRAGKKRKKNKQIHLECSARGRSVWLFCCLADDERDGRDVVIDAAAFGNCSADPDWGMATSCDLDNGGWDCGESDGEITVRRNPIDIEWRGWTAR